MAKSSVKTEFHAIAQELYELLWLKMILDDLQIKGEDQVKLYWYNKSAINIPHNRILHDKTKHIKID